MGITTGQMPKTGTLMLKYMLTQLTARGIETEEALNKLLTWIAVQTECEEQLVTDFLPTEVVDQWHKMFNVDALREYQYGKPYDYFHDLLIELGLDAPTVNPKVADILIEGVFPAPALLGPVGTGTSLLSWYSEYGDKIMLFGTESNLLWYRMALLNRHLYKIHAYVLYGNHKELQLELASKNWRYANSWLTPKPSKLKYKPAKHARTN